MYQRADSGVMRASPRSHREAQIHIYRNDAAENNAPEAPTLNEPELIADGVTLSWDSALDDLTPSDALTYDLELQVHGESLGIARHLPLPGNLSSKTSWTLQGQRPGTHTLRHPRGGQRFQRQQRRERQLHHP